jgi:hypothetical protein
MTAHPELDAALLGSINASWTKVALVLARAAKTPGLVFSEEEDEYEILAKRLEQLVATGVIQSRGDISQWRFSEIRKS